MTKKTENKDNAEWKDNIFIKTRRKYWGSNHTNISREVFVNIELIATGLHGVSNAIALLDTSSTSVVSFNRL